MIFIFYILAALLIFLSYRSFRGGIEYLKYFKSELMKRPSEFMPFASVIVPCRGVDEGMKKNLLALLHQDYPDYEVLFVVDDENDAAVSVIETVSREDAEDAEKEDEQKPLTKLIVAAKATDSSQKVENLREAVLHVRGESHVLVFADSDARPSSDWLRNLVAPLENEGVGAATGYRWFISKDPTFASELRSAWNASIASALGLNTKTNFCWGGSMAIRREVFERLEIREKWGGTLSDDFTVTRAMNEAGVSIHFVPKALTASIENCSFRELLEFTTRQMKITRVYAPKLWAFSFFGSGLFNVVMISAFLIAVLSEQNSVAVWVAITTLALVSFFSIGKSWLRLRAVRLMLTRYEPELTRQRWPQYTFWLIAPALFFYNSFAAWISRKMTWRGIEYELVSANETKILSKK
jgi:ceramide glucosyltransferase